MKKAKNVLVPALLATLVMSLTGACIAMNGVQAKAESTNKGSMNITLTDGIAVNYYAELDGSVQSATATFESDVDALDATVTGEKVGDLWKFTYTNVTPQYIDQAFTIKVNDEVFAENYSVAQYCTELQSKTAKELNITQNEYDKSVVVAKDLIYYGQAAKAYKLGGSVTGEQGTAYENNVDGMALSKPVPASGNKIVSATVVFDYVPAVKFGFELPQAEGVTVFVNDKEVELTGSGTEYTATVEKIYATSFDTPIKVELKENETTVQTLTYAINDYTARTQTNASASAEMKLLARALYSYGKGAETLWAIPDYICNWNGTHTANGQTEDCCDKDGNPIDICYYCSGNGATGIAPIVVQAEDDAVVLKKADGSAHNKFITSGNGIDGKGVGSLDRFEADGTVRITFNVEKAGRYALKMRAQAVSNNGGTGSLNLANVFTVSFDEGVTYQAVSGNVLPATTYGTQWKNFYHWTETTLGEYDLEAGENIVWLKKFKASDNMNLDWFSLEYKEAKESQGNTTFSKHADGFAYRQNESLGKATSGVDFTGLYMRIELPASAGADYYDAHIGTDILTAAGVSTATEGKFTKELTFTNKNVAGGQEFKTNVDYVVSAPITVQAEDSAVVIKKANGTDYKKIGTDDTRGSDGGYVHSMDNWDLNGVMTITVTAPMAGKYYLQMRGSSLPANISHDLSTSMAVSMDGNDYAPANGVILRSNTADSEAWKNYYNWTTVTLGQYDLVEGENTIYIKKTKAGQVTPTLDWFKLCMAEEEISAATLVSKRGTEFFYEQDESLAYRESTSWTENYTGIYMRIPLDGVTGDYYDALITESALTSAGVSTATLGTFDKEITFQHSSIVSNTAYKAMMTYTVGKIEPVTVQAEDTTAVKRYKADGTQLTNTSPVSTSGNSGAIGGYLSSLNNASNLPINGYMTINVTVPVSGNYALTMRSAAMVQGSGGRGTQNLNSIFEVSTDGGNTYEGVDATTLPSITFTGSDWQNYYNWTTATLGYYHLNAGENVVYIKKIAEWAPYIDSFTFSMSEPTQESNEVISLRANGFTFTQGEALAYATNGSWTEAYTGIYIRCALSSANANYYDAMITVAQLEAAGVSTAEKGTFTKTLTFSNSGIESGKVFTADITYTVE